MTQCPGLLSFTVDIPPAPEHQAESSAAVGTFAHDLERAGYSLRFEDEPSFSAWLSRIKRENGVEYIKHKTEKDTARCPPNFLKKVTYVCGRQGNGRKKTESSMDRKIPTKQIGCSSRLIVKTYPGTREVLVRYNPHHDSHETGEQNLKFTRLGEDVKQNIRIMVRLGMDRVKIMAKLQSDSGLGVSRGNLITSQDVRRIEREVEDNICRFARDDITSLRIWCAKLREEGHFVILKCKDESIAGFDNNVFVLIIQTSYQYECWVKWGSRFAGLDATHNTTFYQNMHLFTLMCRDNWGRGMPAAWMICSSGQQSTIQAYLRIIHSRSPSVHPRYFMSDKDHAQMNAIREVYCRAALFLCWWHVLRAWRERFNTTAFPELWTLMRKWIRITDPAAFEQTWQRIKSIAPVSVIEYLEKNWMGDDDIKMWSGQYRTGRDVFATCDTNMLVEAWHRLLKHYFMGSKHGRRVDQLVYVLTSMAVPYFRQRHLRQRLGFEGADLAQAEIDRATQAGESIKRADVIPSQLEQVYSVRSQSHRENLYTVHIGTASNCTCPAFPRVLYCKHIRAVQYHYHSEISPRIQSVSALDNDAVNAEDEPCEVDKDDAETVTSVTDAHPSSDHHLPSPPPSDNAFQQRLQSDLAWLACRLLEPLSISATTPFRKLADALAIAHEATQQHDRNPSHAPLPPRKNVAPRQTQQTLTAAAMGTGVKGADKRNRKRKKLEGELDELPEFEAGEESGLKAKPDARGITVTSSGNFDVTTFKIDSRVDLQGLNTLQLQALCKLHHTTTARGDGKDERMVERLLAHASTCQCSRAPSHPPSHPLTDQHPPSQSPVDKPPPPPVSTRVPEGQTIIVPPNTLPPSSLSIHTQSSGPTTFHTPYQYPPVYYYYTTDYYTPQ